jgi:hypothetical protein
MSSVDLRFVALIRERRFECRTRYSGSYGIELTSLFADVLNTMHLLWFGSLTLRTPYSFCGSTAKSLITGPHQYSLTFTLVSLETRNVCAAVSSNFRLLAKQPRAVS